MPRVIHSLLILGDTNISNQNAKTRTGKNMSDEDISEDFDDNYGKHMKSSFVKETPELYLKFTLSTNCWYYF